MRSFITSAGIIAAAVAVTACAEKVTLGPGDVLIGSWINPDTHLTATRTAVIWHSRCEEADFGPITIDSNGTFSATSTSYTLGGNIRQAPGSELRIQGSFNGTTLLISRYTVYNPIGVSDPIAVTLTPGTSNDPLVCNA